MPKKKERRLNMNAVRRLLKLRFHHNFSQRHVADLLGCSRKSVQRYEALVIQRGLTDFNLIDSLSDTELFNQLGLRSGLTLIPLRKGDQLPDWPKIKTELSKKHVTLSLLWSEYIDDNPRGYKYSQFCEHYTRWRKTLSLSMRQEHTAGEKTFVDYAGSTIPIVINPKTMETRDAQIFVGVLGASSYIYCEATWTQSSQDWLMSHRRMFEYFGGVTAVIVPDNLKSGVNKPCRYEALINRSYEECCNHYGTCVIPARVRKPKDKSKAELGVQVISCWIIAALRNKIFYSLEELNEEIRSLLTRINNRKMRHYNKSRKELFENIDKSALLALNPKPYIFSEWKSASVNIDYHVEFEGCFYSVPYQLIGKRVDVRATASTIEILHQCKRVASHQRANEGGRAVTLPEHRPEAHKASLEWTLEKVEGWASENGPDVVLFVKELLRFMIHPKKAYRSSEGLVRLAKKYGKDRLNRSCAKALSVNSISYHTVRNILRNNRDKFDDSKADNNKINEALNSHNNVRGSEYYH